MTPQEWEQLRQEVSASYEQARASYREFIEHKARIRQLMRDIKKDEQELFAKLQAEVEAYEKQQQAQVHEDFRKSVQDDQKANPAEPVLYDAIGNE